MQCVFICLLLLSPCFAHCVSWQIQMSLLKAYLLLLLAVVLLVLLLLLFIIIIIIQHHAVRRVLCSIECTVACHQFSLNFRNIDFRYF